jgi:hypothetical protein
MPSIRRRTPNRTRKPASAASRPALRVIEISRVTSARQRISNGYYDRDEVRDRLAQAVLEELRKA